MNFLKINFIIYFSALSNSKEQCLNEESEDEQDQKIKVTEKIVTKLRIDIKTSLPIQKLLFKGKKFRSFSIDG